MNKETKTCQNCKKDFVIEPEDFSFYEKIKVPAPTWCPDCRMLRRMIFRNERFLYRRKCDLTKKDIISVFSPDSPVKVWDKNEWYSDKFDPLEYGRDYDFSKPFFEQFHELLLDTPLPSLQVTLSENCEYNNDMSYCNNCYMCFRTHKSRDMLYTYRGNSSSQCVDCMQAVDSSELLYECVECVKCYRSSYLSFCSGCLESSFLFNCRNCISCFMCTNLRNKQYCFRNEQLTKEQYKEKLENFDMGSHSEKQRLIDDFEKQKLTAIRKHLTITNAQNSKGDNLFNCRNCYMCFDVKFTENGRYLWNVMNFKESMDAYSGGRGNELTYETTATAGAYNVRFGIRVPDSQNVTNSYLVRSSSDIFGCIGLTQKKNCILNKQYTKEEYEELAPKIIKHMDDMPYKDKQGRIYKYGEFFPPELSPFCYNETIAQEYFPLTKDEAIKQGYSWKDPEKRSYEITIKSNELPDHIKDVSEDIVGKVIECSHKGECNEQCTSAFKIIKEELSFYKRMNLPLPRLCPNCRHYSRLKQRNPLKLWKRKCMCNTGKYHNTAEHFHKDEPCPNEFETSYSPDRKEIVYCEQCYNAEVV